MGGGIYIRDARGLIRGNLIAGNTAHVNGSGALLSAPNDHRHTTFRIVDDVFLDNRRDGTGINVTLHILGVEPKVLIEKCDFMKLHGYAVVNGTPKDFHANDIWWGTTKPMEINRLIYDYYDKSKYGRVLQTASEQPHASEIASRYEQLKIAMSSPTGLKAKVLAGTDDAGWKVRLTWAPLKDLKISGYRIYYDDQGRFPPYWGIHNIEHQVHRVPLGLGGPGDLVGEIHTDIEKGIAGVVPMDVGLQTEAELSIPSHSQPRDVLTVYFAVTAYDAKGIESWYSDSVEVKIKK